MDRFDAMRVFTRIVERRSFTLAAHDLGLPRSTVTDAIKQLERRLGVKLLERTTRHVSPTLDGEAYHRRCLSLIADLEDAEAAFSDAKPKGLLRVSVSGSLARHFIMPKLTEFLAQYPDLDLFLSEGERFVDLVREGIDCVLRVGDLQDSEMIARRVGLLDEITCASSGYLARFGTPKTLDDLEGHRMVGYHSSATGGVLPLEFCVGGDVQTRSLPTSITVNGAISYGAAARVGLGLIQAPRYSLDEDLQKGGLVEVLAAYPPPPSPVSLMYPRNRQLSPRVRVFLDWVTGVFATNPQI